MTKETEDLIKHIQSNEYYSDVIIKLREENNNFKDFYYTLGKLILSIISDDRRFFDISRKNIELELIAKEFF